MVEIKSPSLGLDGSITRFFEEFGYFKVYDVFVRRRKNNLPGLGSLHRSTMPLKLYVMMLDGIKNNSISSNCFSVCYVLLNTACSKVKDQLGEQFCIHNRCDFFPHLVFH